MRKVYSHHRRKESQPLTDSERRMIQRAAADLGLTAPMRFNTWGKTAYFWGMLSGMSGEPNHSPYGGPRIAPLTVQRLRNAFEAGRRDGLQQAGRMDPELVRLYVRELQGAAMLPSYSRERERRAIQQAEDATLDL